MTDITQDNTNRINKLEKEGAVTNVKLDNLMQGINEIKQNHLVHVNDQLSSINTQLTSGFTEVYRQIALINIRDAQQEPNNRLITEIVKYIILALIGAGMALLIIKK